MILVLLLLSSLMGLVDPTEQEVHSLDYEELKEKAKLELDTLSYNVLFNSKTERAFTGELLNEKRKGTYVAKASGLPVFRSEHKYDSKTGWPSFFDANMTNIVLKDDYSFGMHRIEVKTTAGEHLGHVFPDGPIDKGGQRWCINSAALEFIPDEDQE